MLKPGDMFVVLVSAACGIALGFIFVVTTRCVGT